ncbi:hypothetical protein N752_08315 [Desulforamulus aquiferis]|nr:hypothetical protein N752_08315 [Desulforamulus aquiferis]
MIKLLRLLKPYKFHIALVLVLIFLQSLSDLYLPTLMSDIVDIGIVKGDTQYIIKIGTLMLLVTALGTFCSIVANFFHPGYQRALARIFVPESLPMLKFFFTGV